MQELRVALKGHSSLVLAAVVRRRVRDVTRKELCSFARTRASGPRDSANRRRWL